MRFGVAPTLRGLIARRAWLAGVALAISGIALGCTAASGGDAGGEFAGGTNGTLEDGPVPDDGSMRDDGGDADGDDRGDDRGDDHGTDGSAPKFDVADSDPDDDGANDDAGAGEGCDKVDLLFVVDNSESMGVYQQSIVSAFPSLMSSWLAALPASVDLHVGVTTTDRNNAGAWTDACDGELGSLVTHATPSTATADTGSGAACAFSSGTAYMVESASLDDEFACAGVVGSAGYFLERPIDAAATAVSPSMNAAGGCNEGFRRDDALLVIFLLTDEDDFFLTVPSPRFDELVDAAGGDESNVVWVVVNQGNPLYSECAALQVGYTDADRLDGFLAPFTHVFRSSICAASADYATSLAMAADVVATACEQYVPPAG